MNRRMVFIPVVNMIRPQGTHDSAINFKFSTSLPKSFECTSIAGPIQVGFELTTLSERFGSAAYFKEYGWVPDNYPIDLELYTLDMGMGMRSADDELMVNKILILELFFKMTWQMAFGLKAQVFACDIERPDNHKTFDNLFAFIRLFQGNRGI